MGGWVMGVIACWAQLLPWVGWRRWAGWRRDGTGRQAGKHARHPQARTEAPTLWMRPPGAPSSSCLGAAAWARKPSRLRVAFIASDTQRSALGSTTRGKRRTLNRESMVKAVCGGQRGGWLEQVGTWGAAGAATAVLCTRASCPASRLQNVPSVGQAQRLPGR